MRRALAFLVLAAALSSAPRATFAEQPTEDEALQAAMEGMRLVDEGRYAEALPLIERGLTYEQHPKGLFLKALCLYELDVRPVQALAVLKRIDGSDLLSADERARVPELIATIEDRQRRGTLTVALAGGRAGDASVFVDDVAVEGDLSSLRLAPGAHTVRAEGPGCPAEAEMVELAPRGTATVRLRCDDGPARLAIAATEDGAAILVEGEPRGTTPLTVPIELAPGAYTVRIEKDGFLPAQRRVEVGPGDLETLDIELIVEPGDAGEDSAVWAWTTLGTGVALVGVGAGFFVHYGVQYADAQDPPADEEPGSVEDTDLIIGGVATGVGAGLIATSFFLWPDDPSPGDAAVRTRPLFAPLPGGALVGWSGSY